MIQKSKAQIALGSIGVAIYALELVKAKIQYDPGYAENENKIDNIMDNINEVRKILERTVVI